MYCHVKGNFDFPFSIEKKSFLENLHFGKDYSTTVWAGMLTRKQESKLEMYFLDFLDIQKYMFYII